jgi:ADP-ribose pyrophosphatase YjhB (NUDIX family)
MTTLNDFGISLNQPLYLYQKPMFDITVSIVVIVENGVILIKDGDSYRFPSGYVMASKESIQFAAVRYIKEQIGIFVKKDQLIPVDFRSSPDRTKENNIVDIGFFYTASDVSPESLNSCAKWEEVDFENKCLVRKSKFYMDHELLLERAISLFCIVKE